MWCVCVLMADEPFLSSLSAGDALRYKAFISSTIQPKDIAGLLQDALPPAHLLDARIHERLMLALSTAAKVFVIDLAEAALELHAADSGCAGLPLAPGHLQEAWRRKLLRGEILGSSEDLQASAESVREAAAVGGVATSSSSSAAGK